MLYRLCIFVACDLMMYRMYACERMFVCRNGCVRVDVLIFAMMMGVVDTVVIYFFIDTVVL